MPPNEAMSAATSSSSDRLRSAPATAACTCTESKCRRAASMIASTPPAWCISVAISTLILALALTLPLPLALPLTQEPFMASIALRHELKSLFTQARGDVAEMQGRCRGDAGEM